MSDKTITKIIFFCVFISLNLMAGCKKEKTVVNLGETEKKIDYGAFYSDGLSSKKWVTLTFDDGPKPEVIDKIFDILKKENVKVLDN